MSSSILVHERFYTFQGEGTHLGRSAYFIRTYGCAVKCPFCDSRGTWDQEFKPSDLETATPFSLAQAAIKSKAAIVVITGGEPAHWGWREFLREQRILAEKENLSQTVHIETSGAFMLQGKFDWVTVSPKKAHRFLDENLDLADEIKLIIESPVDIAYWVEQLQEHITIPYPPYLWEFWKEQDKPIPVWLHPEWTKREDPDVLNVITRAVKDHPRLFRAGWQLHKLYKADFADPHTRPEIPVQIPLEKVWKVETT